MIIGIYAILIFFTYKILQRFHYRQLLRKIPIRIYVNGSRGKSDVTRLIAAGLRGGGYRVWAKTTGTLPRIIGLQGEEIPIHRHSPANIREQMSIVRQGVKQGIAVLVIECMAVQPELQWISDKKMIQSTIGVITNARLDHLDQMGTNREEVAKSLALTIPYSGKIFTADSEHYTIFAETAHKQGSECYLSRPEDYPDIVLENFPHMVFQENLALALAVVTELGVEEEKALQRMYEYQPDPGAFRVYSIQKGENIIYFANAFAANDPDSTKILLEKTVSLLKPNFMVGVYNHRVDRNFRIALFETFMDKQNFDQLFWIGEKAHKRPALTIPIRTYDNIELLINDLACLPNNTLLFGFGNIKGMGVHLLERLREEGRVRC